MQATALEYKHRYLVHGLIYTLCFAAPWSKLLPPPYRQSVWGFMQNGSIWFQLSNTLSRPTYARFAFFWNSTIIAMILLASAGAFLRVWGAAYLGATTVQRGGMVSERIVADGPFRYVRNPLYLGTILHTLALSLLMRPEAAVLCVVLITLLQLRLIGREEPYLQERLGSAYTAYLQEVPRIIPEVRPFTAPNMTKPVWKQGLLSELYMVGVAITLATVGWSGGYGWEGAILRVMQGILISLGLSVVARAFIPKATF